jgi:Glycosyltransferase 61
MRYAIGPLVHLYENGGSYDDPTLLMDAGDAVGENGTPLIRPLGVVFPAAVYQRSDYELHSDDQNACCALQNTFEAVRASYTMLPSTVAVEVHRARVFDSVIYVAAKEGWSALYPTYRPNDRQSVAKVEQELLGADTVEHIVGGAREYFYLSSAGSFNYGHWLVDDLPRLKYILEISLDAVTLIIQSFPGMDTIRRQTIELLCRDRDVEVRFVDPLTVIEFERLIYVTPVSYHPYLKSPEALKFISEAAVRGLDLVPHSRDRIYVRRRRQRGRALLNECAIESYLVSRGFYTVDPDGLPFEQQVRIFSNASIVVGVMCAAMCNVMFSPRQVTMVVLAPNGWVEPFYWDLATVLEHRYIAIHGQRSNVSPHPHLDDFHINFEVFERVMLSILR